MKRILVEVHPSSFIVHPSFLVDLARFERATSTFAGSRSNSTELQVRRLAEMERFERSQDFSRHLSGVLPYQLGNISNWRKATESNRTRTSPPQFSRLLDSLYCRAFQKKFQIADFGLRIRESETEALNPACGTRWFDAPTKFKFRNPHSEILAGVRGRTCTYVVPWNA